MNELDLVTEVEKLAHVLKVTPDKLSFLNTLTLDNFRSLNQSISDRLLTDSSDVWKKLAGVAKFTERPTKPANKSKARAGPQ